MDVGGEEQGITDDSTCFSPRNLLNGASTLWAGEVSGRNRGLFGRGAIKSSVREVKLEMPNRNLSRNIKWRNEGMRSWGKCGTREIA